MMRERILYTDGHEVTVTNSSIKVKNTQYQLKGITKHGFFIMHPGRFTSFFMVMAGGMMTILGALQLMPSNVIPKVEIYSIVVNADAVTLALGLALFLTGVILLVLKKDRYAIWIATAEGEKNVVVVRKPESIRQILDALNHAFLNLISPTLNNPEQAN
jgi:Family of unknown function (DUF6232)